MAIITFKDLQGAEQSVDLDGKFNVAFNCDCETIMQAMPDKCVDLLCADPPYGDGSSQSVNVERERERETQPQWNRFGQRFDRYKHTEAPIPRRREEGPVEEVPPSERHIMSTGGGGGTPSTTSGTVARTGGTWAEKYGKKS